MAGRPPARPTRSSTGLDPNLTYLRLAAAADCVRAGARFIATNRDPVYPTERGLRPGAGASPPRSRRRPGVTPLSIGKPAPQLLELAARGRRSRARRRGDHDRRRDRDRPRRGPGRRGALRAHADRGDAPGSEVEALADRRPADGGRGGRDGACRRLDSDRGASAGSSRLARRPAPGCPPPRRRTPHAAAPASPRRRRRHRAPGGRSPTARAGSARSASTALTYSSDSLMSETVVSSVLRVTGTPAPMEPGRAGAPRPTARCRPASSRSGTGRG